MVGAARPKPLLFSTKIFPSKKRGACGVLTLLLTLGSSAATPREPTVDQGLESRTVAQALTVHRPGRHFPQISKSAGDTGKGHGLLCSQQASGNTYPHVTTAL